MNSDNDSYVSCNQQTSTNINKLIRVPRNVHAYNPKDNTDEDNKITCKNVSMLPISICDKRQEKKSEPTLRCRQNPFIGALRIQEPVILHEPQIKS